MTTPGRTRAALLVITPTGGMRTVDGSVGTGMVNTLLTQAETVERGPLRMVLVVPRPDAIEPHIIGRSVTPEDVDTLTKMIKGRSTSAP